MDQHVGIGMARQTAIVGNGDAADDERAASAGWREAMHVVANANAHRITLRHEGASRFRWDRSRRVAGRAEGDALYFELRREHRFGDGNGVSFTATRVLHSGA